MVFFSSFWFSVILVPFNKSNGWPSQPSLLTIQYCHYHDRQLEDSPLAISEHLVRVISSVSSSVTSLFEKMGRVRNNRRKNSKKKEYKKAFKTDNRARDVDQIQEDLIKEKERGEKMAFAADEDLPGLGQFYCTPCGRHFFDEASLTSHANSRGHIRRCVALSLFQLCLLHELIVLLGSVSNSFALNYQLDSLHIHNFCQ